MKTQIKPAPLFELSSCNGANGARSIQNAPCSNRIGAIRPNGAELAPEQFGLNSKQGQKRNWRDRQSQKIDRTITLRGELKKLVKQEEEASLLVQELSVLNAPLKAEFEFYDNQLRGMWVQRKDGRTVTRQQMLPAYDARMNAGHKWNPVRQKLKDAQGWMKRVRDEILNINSELG